MKQTVFLLMRKNNLRKKPHSLRRPSHFWKKSFIYWSNGFFNFEGRELVFYNIIQTLIWQVMVLEF